MPQISHLQFGNGATFQKMYFYKHKVGKWSSRQKPIPNSDIPKQELYIDLFFHPVRTNECNVINVKISSHITKNVEGIQSINSVIKDKIKLSSLGSCLEIDIQHTQVLYQSISHINEIRSLLVGVTKFQSKFQKGTHILFYFILFFKKMIPKSNQINHRLIILSQLFLQKKC